MTRLRRQRLSAGFTMVEVILVVAIVGIMSAILIPTIGQMIRVSKMRGATTVAEGILRRCRYEAIKRGVPCRVNIDPVTGDLFAFSDVHGPAQTDPPDGLFNPIAAQPLGTTDYEVRRQLISGGITLQPPDGFTAGQVVFDPDGSVEDVGAVRFADPYGNLLELRITTTTASRIELLKFQDGAYRSQGEQGEAWSWD